MVYIWNYFLPYVKPQSDFIRWATSFTVANIFFYILAI